MFEEIEHVNPQGIRGPSRVTIRIGDGRPVTIGDNVIIGEDVFMAGGTVIGDNATIGNSCQFGIGVVIGDNVRIEQGCSMSNTKIGQRSHIGVMARSDMWVTIGEDVRIGNFCHLGPLIEIENNVIIGDHFTTISYTTIGAHSNFGDYVHLDRDITIGERVIIETGCSLFGKQQIPDRVRVSYVMPEVRS